MRGAIHRKEEEIKQAQNSNDPLRELQTGALEKDLENFLEEEEKHWRIEARED